MNAQGDLVVDINYDAIHHSISGGFATVQEGNKFKVYQFKKGEISDSFHAMPRNCKEGMYFFPKNKFINYNTNEIITHDWAQSTFFENGFALVRKKNNAKFYLINKKGEKLSEETFEIGYFANGYWILRMNHTSWKVFNTKTKVFSEEYEDYRNCTTTPEAYEDGWIIRNRAFIVGDNAFAVEGYPEKNKYGYIVTRKKKQSFYSLEGELILNNSFESIFPISEDQIMAKQKDSEYTFIYDYEGNRLGTAPNKLNHILPFSEGYAVARKQKGKADVFGGFEEIFGFIDAKGEFVIEGNYNDARSFKNGIAAVRLKNGPIDHPWILINTKGERISKNYFSEIGW